MKKISVGIIGAGNMGGALAFGMKKKGYSVSVSDAEKDKLESARKKGIAIAKSNVELCKKSNVIIIAVKPFAVKDVCSEIAPFVKNKLVFSIAASVPTSFLQKNLPGARVMRVMPNTPALVGEGAIAYSMGKNANKHDEKLARILLSSVGKCFKVSEKHMAAITAFSGAGSAYYYYIINAFALAAEKEGISKKLALALSAQTAKGAAEMLMKTGIPPEALIQMVATKGGITEQGLRVLSDEKVSEIMQKVLKAGIKKAEKIEEQFK